jgi:hypothetical protein
VVPYWQSTVDKVAQIGAHVFYRWSGPLGQPRAFGYAYAGAEPLPANVQGFDLTPVTTVSADAVMAAPLVADREPSPFPKVEVTTSEGTPAAARSRTVALLATVLPPKLETRPAGLSVDGSDPSPASSRHLAIPASW